MVLVPDFKGTFSWVLDFYYFAGRKKFFEEVRYLLIVEAVITDIFLSILILLVVVLVGGFIGILVYFYRKYFGLLICFELFELVVSCLKF